MKVLQFPDRRRQERTDLLILIMTVLILLAPFLTAMIMETFG